MDVIRDQYKKCDISISQLHEVSEGNQWSFQYCITIHAVMTDEYLKTVQIEATSMDSAIEEALSVSKKVIEELLEDYREI